MNYGVYSIRDIKTGFMSLTLEQNDEAAARNFYHAVANSDGILYSFRRDFALYKIAEFDAAKGVLAPVVPILLVADGADAQDEVQA